MILQATPEEAIELLKNKTDPASRHSLAIAYRTVNNLDASQEIAFDLWQKDGFREPELALLISNLFLDCGNYVRSEEWAMNGWQLQAPEETPEFALPLAMARMRLGMWDRLTWHLWEIGREGKSWNVVPGTERWRGEELSEGGLAVLSEGGYGDMFLFHRFLTGITGHSTLFFGPQFAGLKGFRDDWGMEQVWFDDKMPSLSAYEYSTALMSFMATLDVKSPEGIPASAVWTPRSNIGIPEWDNTDHFHRPTSMAISRGKRIGLCWRAEENGVQKRIRSIRLEELEPLNRFRFVSLIPGESSGSNCTMLQINDWIDTARIIAGLDCVVSVDTAVAHLAGLLGVPCIVILPLAVDWKHGVSGDKSWWWPSWTLVRNDSPYSFRGAIERVAEMLEKL